MAKRKAEESSTSTKKTKIDPQLNQVLYLNNLNDQINPETVKINLYLLCAAYGDVIDIVLKPNSKKMRGQAHVIFSNLSEAQMAKEKLQDRKLFGKELRIQYARRKSKIIKRIERDEL